MITTSQLSGHILSLIEKTSQELPGDVIEALTKAKKNEERSSTAYNILEQLLQNISLAKDTKTPICQDTGTNIYYVYHPAVYSHHEIEESIKDATILATQHSILRPNMVDPITGKNTGHNIGIDHPVIHFHQWEKDYMEIKLMLKGGGSENVGAQYKLPDSTLNAGRDLEGVRKCILDAVFKAQGEGCAPGIIGVGIGGDRGTSYVLSKEQFWRKLNDTNENTQLAELEKKLFEELNSLGIGPMGLGGKTTVLGVKIGYKHRVPACYFVSVSYLCWAARRRTLRIWDDRVEFE